MSKYKTDVQLIEFRGRTLSKRTEYYENGQIYRVGTYSYNQSSWSWSVPVGPVKTYYEDGQLESVLNYTEDGVREGDSIFYTKKGEIARKLTYSNDRLIKEEVFEITPEVKVI